MAYEIESTIVHDFPYLKIRWDPVSKSVIMHWLRFAGEEEFKKALDAGLDLLIKNKTPNWIADMRGMKVVPQEVQDWSNNNWFPRAIKGGVRNMALIVPSSVMAGITVKKIMNKVGSENINTQYYEDPIKGQEWISSL